MWHEFTNKHGETKYRYYESIKTHSQKWRRTSVE